MLKRNRTQIIAMCHLLYSTPCLCLQTAFARAGLDPLVSFIFSSVSGIPDLLVLLELSNPPLRAPVA